MNFCVRGIVAVAALVLFAGSAAAGTPPEDFVQQSVDRGVAIMKDSTLSTAERRAQVEALLGTVMNTRKLAQFCLGKVGVTASPADIEAFTAAFTAFTKAKYSSQLGGYGGQSLKVTGSVARGPGDTVVTAVLVPASGLADPDPIKVLFRVLGEGDQLGVVDASIVGVWFGMAQRDDIQGFLATHNNDLEALTARMAQMTADLNAGVAR